MTRWLIGAALLCACASPFISLASAQEANPAPPQGSQVKSSFTITEDDWKAVKKDADDALIRADSAWMLMSSALVLLMVPGLALFYGGMVRRKNVLATMMQSMVALAVVGVYWIAVGYALAFGDPWIKSPFGEGSLLGWNPELFFLHGVSAEHLLPNTKIPVFLHMLFQGMFAIITPALISGAVAERIRFKPYCLFLIAWVTLVYCPLAHCVWAMDWNWVNTLAKVPDAALLNASGAKAVGWLGMMGALDFAGGTVVHIAAGFSSLAAFLVLRKRLGYPQHSFHPNSMVLTLTGAGILWFGWFGFNGGSGLISGSLATSAFAATQAAAAAAALSWLLVEWLHRGKPTALGLASGLVAGLVAVTPASGFILPWGGLCIGLISGAVCYVSVNLKSVLKYDDSLDAFGVHGVGGFLGAILTGVFCLKAVNSAGADGLIKNSDPAQLGKQLYAAAASAVLAFVVSLILVKLIDLVMGFVTTESNEIEGLDRTEHGETGFDFGLAQEAAVATTTTEPRPALIPPNQRGRFQAVVEGVSSSELSSAWNELCQPNGAVPAEFKTVYPYVTTVQGNRFQFRGGDKELLRDNLQRLFQNRLKMPVKVKVDA